MKLANELSLKEKFKKNLCELFKLNIDSINNDTILFPNFIDSLDYLKFATLAKNYAVTEFKIEIDMIHFLNSGPISINEIFNYFESIV